MTDDKTRIKPDLAVDTQRDDDRTVLAPKRDGLEIELLDARGNVLGHFKFADGFTAGRAADNGIVITHDVVSRYHMAIRKEAGVWWLYNLNSTNGVFIDGRLIPDKEILQFPVMIALGVAGVYLHIRHDQQAAASRAHLAPDATLISVPERQTNTASPHRPVSQADIEARLLAEEDSPDMGDYTLMARRVIHKDRVKRSKSYEKVIWALAGLFVAAVGLVTYQQIALENTRKLAIDMFYDIKSLEVNIARADIKLEESAAVLDETLAAIASEKLRISQEQLKLQQEQIAAERLRMRQERERLANMKAKYRQYVDEANSLRLRFPTAAQYENELIAKVARELGESELELPEEFVSEVRKYIQYWQGTARLQTAIAMLEKENLLEPVIAGLKNYGLPLYFIYLPLQESNYDTRAIGPETRFGIAKGAWQLLASTAREYGITPGPLAEVREYDEQDGRFDFAQATQAGIKYLRKIYSTEAQASGLLVMASYNYGDNRVKGMIRQMPDNPRDRNFWTFLQNYELPAETRDYVFYIFSAAVIGEDPQHFGFKFNPPLYKLKS
ncbi:transglycosylase SLT domain-containing protein [Methylomonas sp. SURF-2]|uniref:Transglycosylase SLT domain-containing protein n=1 Tax=Methylomonas subterranea TaxID=2952225 RepID=A0ABT1TED1_9GAMM|nr:FHA domain-containing protein [Methylomonas sp. SURF-2]MCQ8103805.1 transglycosylase SLT domain-containing protein [Methylomonas sp. SURF-2]